MSRSTAIIVGVGAALLASSPAAARADQTDVCIDASVRGQELRDRGKLRAARAELLSCAAPACPHLLQTECIGWLADVDARTPSIVIGAIDAAGRDTADVVVTLDGAPFLARLDGTARPIDPGAHTLRFEHAGSPAVEQRVILREGERRRAISARISPSPAAHVAVPVPGPGRPIAVAALGGLAVASGVTFAVLGLGARRDADDLRTTCAPACAASAVDAVRRKEIGANVALGIGVLAAGAAAILVVTWPTPVSTAASVAAQPLDGGAIARLTLRF